MRRIATSNAVPNLFGAGKSGFQASAPGVTATHWSAAFANDSQEEIVAAIEAAGIALDPDGTHQHQLLQAMRQMFGGPVITKTHADTGHQLTEDEAGLVLIDASGGVVNMTLPAAARPQLFRFYRIDSSPANGCTITAHGTDPYQGTGAPGAFVMRPTERREMLSYAGGWREFGKWAAAGTVAQVWAAQGNPAGGTTTSTTFQSAGSTLSIVKLRQTNSIEFIGQCHFQNDTSSSSLGAQAKARMAVDTGGGYGIVGLESDTGLKINSGGGSIVMSSKFAAVVMARDDGSLPATYNAQLQFASLAGDFVNNTLSNVIGIEKWN